METLVSLALSGTGTLGTDASVVATMDVSSALQVISGLYTEYANGLTYVQKYVGEENAPQDIKRLRRQVYELMRRMGQPVIIKHMFNDDDVQAGIAKPSPNFDEVYGQTRGNDPLSHGIGLVSVETSDNEWLNTTTGELVLAPDQPAAHFEPAPKYRGFGPGFLNYVIQPDMAEDIFKLDPTGALIHVQSAKVQMGWFPVVSDNDLVINVVLDNQGRVVQTTDRFQAKMTDPISIRGLDRRGRSEFPRQFQNRHLVNQLFEMSLLPSNHILNKVETDR